MRLLSIIGGLAFALLNVLPTIAAEPVRFALCYDLSKAYTFVSPQIAQAARDYAELLNSRGVSKATPSRLSSRITATSLSEGSNTTNA